MGVLDNVSAGRRFTLATRCIVGRAPTADLRLDDRVVSAEHAAVFWSGEIWEVRDLGSSNGTKVDGRRLGPGERAPLSAGSEVAFGADSPALRWRLWDASPPVPVAVCEQTRVRHELAQGLCALPSDDEPVVTLYAHLDEWRMERDGAAQTVCDQERVVVGSRSFVLYLPPGSGQGGVTTTVRTGGPSRGSIDHASLHLRVSRDEEYVEVTLRTPAGERTLAPRSQHYVLVTLARCRLEDARAGATPASEHGWLYVEDLLRMLGTTRQKLNLDVFRIRRQLADAGVTDAHRIVERRATTQQLRLGIGEIEIAEM